MTISDGLITPAVDKEAVQAAVLRAAVAGDEACRARLPALLGAFEEPYRTVGGEVLRLLRQYTYLDANVLGSALTGRRLVRPAGGGRTEELQAGQVLGLVFNTALQPGQAAAYLDVLEADLQARRRAELKARVQEAAARFADEPERLIEEMRQAASAAEAGGQSGADRHPSEVMEIIPYAQQLEQGQAGAEFAGLDSGFPVLNELCNGLDAGLYVVAGPPGRGKTTLVWQTCCQAAEVNRVPVIFVSLEQSKKELRAKALARLARVPYRDVLRRRPDAAGPEWPSLLDALHQYGLAAPYLTVVEGDESTTVSEVRRLAEAKMARMGAARCLVAVDYLQIVPLAQEEAGRVASVKDKVDLNVSAFRRLARDLGACVLCVSSENRAGYEGAGLAVFKESGGIEYAADVAAVLTRDRAAPAQGDYRALKLNVVKNRNGECGVVKFKFYPRRAEFREEGRESLPADADYGG